MTADAGSDAKPSPGVGVIDTPIIQARFVRRYPPAAPAPSAATRYLPFRGHDLIVPQTESETGDYASDQVTNYALATMPPLPLPVDDGEAGATTLYLGDLDGAACVAYSVAKDAPVPEGFQTVGLRDLYSKIDDDEYALAGYAAQLLRWRREYRFCPRCGAKANPLNGGWGMICPVCELVAYPPATPAVLALIHDGGDRVLLASKPGWGTRFSIVAGFTEPGESFEGCVAREILEEVGVHVRDIVYDGSQPWAFPHQIMVGFTARWVGGDIAIDTTELADGRWFRYDALPDLPGALSLSRQIIDRWVGSRIAANVSEFPPND